jgi:hypothetical protein
VVIFDQISAILAPRPNLPRVCFTPACTSGCQGTEVESGPFAGCSLGPELRCLVVLGVRDTGVPVTTGPCR